VRNRNPFVTTDVLVNQIDNSLYVVYNGQAGKLRQRASEYFKGSKGTGCLALFNIDTLKGYKWSFMYLDDCLIIINVCRERL